MKIAETILRALTEPVLLLDGSLRAVTANPAFYEALQIDVGELEGKSLPELIAEESGRPHLSPILAPILSHDSRVEDLEIACTIPPDTRKVFLVNAKRITLGDGLTEMLLIEIRDITLQRESERKVQELIDAQQHYRVQLEAINTELEAFSHSVSHDLRAPLRLTNKIAHLILQTQEAQLPADVTEKIHMILNSTQEMGKLIEDLLTFSQANRGPLIKRRVDLKHIVREAVSDLKDEQQGRSVEIFIDELPSCEADRALVKQVFLNLLANALKFTRPRERTEIQVGFSGQCEEPSYFVRDNGIGFDMSSSEPMFVAFHRLHNAHGFEGSGIGLALVKRIVERHGGRIWAEGTPGKGATVYFTLGNLVTGGSGGRDLM